MNEERREQIRTMLTDILYNMDCPNDYPFEEDFRRDWLHAVCDVANNMAREI